MRYVIFCDHWAGYVSLRTGVMLKETEKSIILDRKNSNLVPLSSYGSRLTKQYTQYYITESLDEVKSIVEKAKTADALLSEAQKKHRKEILSLVRVDGE